jgi:hypothetical protein
MLRTSDSARGDCEQVPLLPFPLLALVAIPALAEAVTWLAWYVLLSEEGNSLEGGLLTFGAPAVVSALVVYRLARQRRLPWAIAAAAATPAWYFIFWLVAVAVFDPN